MSTESPGGTSHAPRHGFPSCVCSVPRGCSEQGLAWGWAQGDTDTQEGHTPNGEADVTWPWGRAQAGSPACGVVLSEPVPTAFAAGRPQLHAGLSPLLVSGPSCSGLQRPQGCVALTVSKRSHSCVHAGEWDGKCRVGWRPPAQEVRAQRLPGPRGGAHARGVNTGSPTAVRASWGTLTGREEPQ